jgi:hypothetical protein
MYVLLARRRGRGEYPVPNSSAKSSWSFCKDTGDAEDARSQEEPLGARAMRAEVERPRSYARGRSDYPSSTFRASSRYLQYAFANRICRADLQSGSKRRGLATRMQAQRAREVATSRRSRL